MLINDEKQLAAVIKDARKGLSLEQETLAGIAGTTRKTIGKLESRPGSSAFDNVVTTLSALGYELHVVPKCNDNTYPDTPDKQLSSHNGEVEW